MSDRDALGELLHAADCGCGEFDPDPFYMQMVDAIMPWLAEHDVEVRRLVLQPILDLHQPEHWETDRFSKRRRLPGIGVGKDAVTTCAAGCGRWPCATARAAGVQQ